MESGQIDNLFIYNTNPLFTYPDRERLNAALDKVSLKVALATTKNETTEVADFVLPVHHAIESWGIDEPETDVYSLVQPARQNHWKTFCLVLVTILPAIRTTKNLLKINGQPFIEKCLLRDHLKTIGKRCC